jgi:hypothetical protein
VAESGRKTTGIERGPATYRLSHGWVKI